MHKCVSEEDRHWFKIWLWPAQHSAIAWSTIDVFVSWPNWKCTFFYQGFFKLLIRPLEHISVTFESKYNNSHLKNAFENVVCEMMTILSRLQCIKFIFKENDLLKLLGAQIGVNSKCCAISSAILNHISLKQACIRSICEKNVARTMSSFVATIVPTDDQAPFTGII